MLAHFTNVLLRQLIFLCDLRVPNTIVIFLAMLKHTLTHRRALVTRRKRFVLRFSVFILLSVADFSVVVEQFADGFKLVHLLMPRIVSD